MKHAAALAIIGAAAVLVAVAIALDPTVVEAVPEPDRPTRPRPRSYTAPAVRTGRWVKGGDA